MGAVDIGIGDCTGGMSTGRPDELAVGDAMMRAPGANDGADGYQVGRGSVAGAGEGIGNVGCGIAIWAARSDAKEESPVGAGGRGLPCPIVTAAPRQDTVHMGVLGHRPDRREPTALASAYF